MGSSTVGETMTILHFNDVYNIESRKQEPVGGAARFTTAVKSRAHLNPILLFSGDAFNPSVMSAVTKGSQMVPVMNELGIHCAVYGNHDFDFGVDKLVELADSTNFPWLMSNVVDNLTDRPLADGRTSFMLPWGNIKVGVVGLVEEEWIATLSTVDPDDITYLDYVEEGRELAQQLRQEGADVVIALTHMRWPNDVRLAQEVEEIDLILGGHDHDYNVQQVNGKYIVKSGTDFRQLSQITLTFTEDSKVAVKVTEVEVNSTLAEDETVKDIVAEYTEVMGERMNKVLGHLEVEMDGRFASIRTQETNLGNFVTNIMLECTKADVALLNSGTLRSDTVHCRGPFTLRDLLSILPMVDPLVVVHVSGSQLLEALENGVSQYPKLEGRFPQVSGLVFGFDPTLPPHKRVKDSSVRVNGQPLDLNKMYRLCTKHYLAEGKDGYEVLRGCEQLLNEEEGPSLSTCVQNHFLAVQVVRGERKSRFQHHQSLISLTRRDELDRQLSVDFDTTVTLSDTVDGPHTTADPIPCTRRNSTPSHPTPVSPSSSHVLHSNPLHRRHTAKSARMLQRRESIQSVEVDQCAEALAPQVEGRIYLINSQRLGDDHSSSTTGIPCSIPEETD